MVIDELIVIENGEQKFVDSAYNTTIDVINVDGVDYHFAKENEVTDGVCENAVAEPIIDINISGNSKQVILPNEYQQVEHVECTGTQYIDTLINPANKKIGAILDFQFTSASNPKAGVFGSYKTDGIDNIQFTIFTLKWRIKINSFGAYGNTYDTARHIVRLNMPDGTKIDDTSINETQYTINSTNTTNLYLCACNYDTANETTNYSLRGKLYSAKIYDDETLIRDYVPCYRISDNVIGLYDLVENKFYENIGTGTFSKGDNVPTANAPIEVESVGDRTKNLFDTNYTIENINNYYCIVQPVPAGTYTISATGTVNSADYILLHVVDGDNNIVSNHGYIVNGNDLKTKIETVVVEEGQKIRFRYATNQASATLISVVKQSFKRYQWLIEPGNIVTDYEPYGYKIPVKTINDIEEYTTNIYLKEPLRKIDEYADYIDFENKILHKKIVELVLDGTENWSSLNLGRPVAYFVLVIGDLNYAVSRITLNTHFKYALLNNTTKDMGSCIINSTTYNNCRLAIRPDLNTYTSVALFKNFLAEQYAKGTPVKAYYVLTTPTEESIDIPEISTSNGTNIVDIQTTIKPSEVKTTYWRQISVEEITENIVQTGSNILIISTGAEITQSGTNLTIGE